MLDQICRHIRNYFHCVEMHEGNYKIENGKLSLSFANDNDYILIEGSKHNDGIYQWQGSLDTFRNEEFRGFVSVRALPREFEALTAEIEEYCASNTQKDALVSESFGGYSYSKATNARGVMADWPTVFNERLNQWRKI